MSKNNNPENNQPNTAEEILENAPITNKSKELWDTFYNIFPELEDEEFSAETISLINAGATPLEAFMLSILATAFDEVDKLA